MEIKHDNDHFTAFELGARAALDYVMALASNEPNLKGRALIEKLLEYRNRATQIPHELRDLKPPKIW